MNSMYLIVILGVILLVFCIIGYYLYQESKFRKMVENTFNQKTDDILMNGNKRIVFEGENRSIAIKFDDDLIVKDKVIESSNENNNSKAKTFVLDTHENNTEELINATNTETKESDSSVVKNLFADEEEKNTPSSVLIKPDEEDEVIPEDSMEAFFAKFDKIEFQFADKVQKQIDLIIDVVFEESIKIKSLPDIAQYTEKTFNFYALDKNNIWSTFESGKKHVINGLKLVVELVDRDGIINQAQISNIYNTLYHFVLDNHGHIRVSSYATDLENIRNSVNHIEDIELDLNLYLLAKESLHYNDLANYLKQNNFAIENGVFVYKNSHGENMFELSDENGKVFNVNKSYNLITITSRLHLQKDPLVTIDKIFDFAESFMGSFESRVLTTNKLVFGEKEYKALTDYVDDYLKNAQKYGIELGGALLKRVY